MLMGDILNSDTLAALRELDEPGSTLFLRDIVTTYLSDSQVRMQAMQEAHRASDVATLAKTAHALKGSSLNVGADSFAALLQRIEKDGKAGVLCAAADLAAAQSLFGRVRDALKAYVA